MRFAPRLDRINNTRASDHLNLIRGLAAFAVLVGHTRALFFTNYSSLSKPSFLLKLLYFLSGLGHEAVLVFFVLSGYFIGIAVLRAATDQWCWSRYLLQRLTRLLVVLVPGLSLCAFWDFSGIHLLGTNGIYGGNVSSGGVITWAVAHRLTWATALGNLVFLQGISVPTFGSNGPLWSLNYELWYYILFPVLVLAVLFLARKPWLTLMYACCTVLIVLLVGRDILIRFPIWLLGAVVALTAPYIRGRQICLACGAGLLHVSTLWVSRAHIAGKVVADYIVGISFATFLLAVLTFRDPSHNSGYARKAKLLAGFSYTLYLVHLPFLVFVRALLLPNNERWTPDGRNLICGVLLVTFATLYAYGIATLTEFKTESVRRAVETMTNLSSRDQHPPDGPQRQPTPPTENAARTVFHRAL
jgi:peptidoglycan/LPS O-acetylase OafA/YrhL